MTTLFKNNCTRFLIILTTLLTACSEDFLDLTPVDAYTSENFWENEFQIDQALNAVYPILRNIQVQTLWKLGEFRSDNTTFFYNPSDRGGVALEELDYFLANSSAGVLNEAWNGAYNGISRANFILANIESAEFTNEENRDIRAAETRFLRAFFYLILIQNYGDVPLTLEPLTDEAEALSKDRVPVAQILSEAIFPDLEFAIQHLPENFRTAETGRATKGAAQMLLAKVYFYQRDFQAALPLLDSLIASDNYQLLANYRDVFDPAMKNHSESIFDAQFATAANQGSGFMTGWLPWNSGQDITQGVVPTSRDGLNIPTQDLIRAYEEGDRRLEASIGFYADGNDTVPYSSKFVFPPIEVGGTDVNWPIFRYADVLLMQAEALLEVEGGLPNQAFLNLNQLRSRAGLGLLFPGNPDPDLNIDTPEKLREAIRRERRVELAFESQRWYDLVRYGNFEEVMLAHGEEQKQLQSFLDPLPTAYTNITELIGLPAGQVLQFGYEQNPGW